jgi:hypothetical protein
MVQQVVVEVRQAASRTIAERTAATSSAGTSVSPCTSLACLATVASTSSSEEHTQRASQPGTTSPQAKDFISRPILDRDFFLDVPVFLYRPSLRITERSSLDWLHSAT